MKFENLFLRAGVLWMAFSVDDIMGAFSIDGDSLSFLPAMGFCIYPVFFVVLPFLYSSDENCRPQWIRTLVLLQTIFVLMIPPLSFFLTGKKCDITGEATLLSVCGPVCVGGFIYLLVCVTFLFQLFKIQRRHSFEDSYPLKLDFLSTAFMAWCIAIPVLFDFSFQVKVVYWLSGLYYLSSLTSKKPVEDLILSCGTMELLPTVVIISSLGKGGESLLDLFGILFENSTLKISEIIVLMLFPTLFFLIKLYRTWKVGHENNV